MSVVKSLSVGNGDMFYIKHGSDSFSIIDCCMPDDRRNEIVEEVLKESRGKGIVRFISTHPDQDHICGLLDLDERLNFLNFYCVKNNATKREATEDFGRYCELRDHPSKAFHIEKGSERKWINRYDDERGSAGLSVLWPVPTCLEYQLAQIDASYGGCPNNISIVLTYALSDGAKFMWMGDLETEFMEGIAEEIELTRAHVLFAPHHGRNSGRVPQSWLDRIQPELIVVGEAPSEHLHYYPDYNTITQNSAGDITFDCVTGQSHVYVSNNEYEVDFLMDKRLPNRFGKYLGSLVTD